jgi:FkbM family methyltransferase
VNQDERLGDIVRAYQYYFGNQASVIFDCGTRDGDDAAYLKEKLNAVDVYAIDASPSAVELTRNNHPDLTVINTALSNYNGIATFTEIISDRKDHVGSSSFILAPGWDGQQTREIETEVKTMRTLLTELGLTKTSLDVVKVDLEGFTYEFLEGMGECIRNAKVLHLETETFARHQGHRTNKDVAAYMISKGFFLDSVSYEWGPQIEDQLWVRQE